jgi:zinc protease
VNLLLLMLAESEPAPAAIDETLLLDETVQPEVMTGPDRSKRPEVQDPTVLTLPETTKTTVHPGLDVHSLHTPWARKVELQLQFHHGRLKMGEGQQTEEARMMAWLWDVATEELDGAALSELKDLHEIELWSTADADTSTLVLRVPAEHLSVGLDLLSQVLHSPAFPDSELKLAKRDRNLQFTVEIPASQGALAGEVMADAWYPADHPYGPRTDLDALDAVTPEGLKNLHTTLLANAPVDVIALGPVKWKDLEAPLVAALGDIGVPGERQEQFADPDRTGTIVYAVDMPGQAQVAIRLRLPAPGRYHADRTAFSAVNFALTGTFLSRLNKNLREQKGWTYGVHGGYSVSPLSGQVGFSVDVPLDKARPTMNELESELATMAATGPTPGELDSRHRDKVSSWNTRLQTSESARSFYAGLVEHEETLEDRLANLEAFGTVTLEDTTRVAKTYLGEDAPRVWVVVGDREGLEPALEGYEVLWIQPSAAAVGAW